VSGWAPILLAAVLLSGQTEDKPRIFAEKRHFNVGWFRRHLLTGRRDALFLANRSDIFVSDSEDGRWLTPALAEFSGRYRDGDPFASPDGLQLFFWSSRPLDGRQGKDWRSGWWTGEGQAGARREMSASRLTGPMAASASPL